MKSVVLMLLVSVQVCLSNQQNILPEHKRRHCNALQTADIMEYALPEIRRILQADAEENRRLLQSEAEKNRRLLQGEAENNKRLPQTEAENNKRLLQAEAENYKRLLQTEAAKNRRLLQAEAAKNRRLLQALKGVILLKCEPGWVYYNDNCYLFSQTRKILEGAVEECQNMDAYLADINSYEENRFVKMELNSLHKVNILQYEYYLGGFRSNLNSKWTWRRTGNQFGYTDWRPTEPNNQTGDEYCLTIVRWSGGHSFGWNDLRCNKTISFICKKRVQQQMIP